MIFENGTLSGYIRQIEQGQARLVKKISQAQSFKGRLTLPEVDPSIPAIWPTEGTITSLYGMRRDPFLKTYQFHSGVDIANFKSTDVLATASGRIEYSGKKSGYGNAVVINHGNGYKTLYGHCERLFVARGDKVQKKTLIAAMGSTGRSTGDHLHYEVVFAGEPLDPTMFVE
ncbi:MAG: M23 family metallopeptidase [Deltaproteobacteria bacterium]|nr:M23 family metallopeptidase [Deltaproteobacteria bacterium]